MRLLTAIGVAALIVAFCVPAFAETQSVKVSGDISVTYVYQNDLDLAKGTQDSDADNFFMQQVGLNVDADLTDNVATFVRVVSERIWDDGLSETLGGGTTVNIGNFFVNLDEAYITLKEFLYAPLTVKIGRQDMWFGKGLIIGANANVWGIGQIVETGVSELSEFNAFDAIRGTLDYDPWTIDLVYAKIDDPDIGKADDVDLYGVNVGYLFDSYEAEAEAYYWAKHDQSIKPGDSATHQVAGLRGSLVPYADMNIWAEGALQFGEHSATRDLDAWAFDVGVDYKWIETTWTPKLSVEYQHLSGNSVTKTSGDYEGWEPWYKGKVDSLIREYMDVVYNTSYTSGTAALGNTNQNQLKGVLTVEPITDVTLASALSYFWLAETAVAGNSDDEIGFELDETLSYDYTEDVSFIVKAGLFWPGDFYAGGQDDRATKVISAVKVEF